MNEYKLCKTCNYWDPVKEGEYAALPGSGGCSAAKPFWTVTETVPPDYKVCRLLPGCSGVLSMVADGSEYRAELITMPDFGCIRHSELEK